MKRNFLWYFSSESELIQYYGQYFLQEFIIRLTSNRSEPSLLVIRDITLHGTLYPQLHSLCCFSLQAAQYGYLKIHGKSLKILLDPEMIMITILHFIYVITFDRT